MRTNSQHTSLPHDGDIHDDDIAWPSRRRAGVRGRTLRGVAVGAFSITFVLAGQSVARADDGWDHSAGHSWGDHWSGDSWGYRWNGEGAATAAEAAAPAVAPAATPGELVRMSRR